MSSDEDTARVLMQSISEVLNTATVIAGGDAEQIGPAGRADFQRALRIVDGALGVLEKRTAKTGPDWQKLATVVPNLRRAADAWSGPESIQPQLRSASREFVKAFFGTGPKGQAPGGAA